MAITATVPTNGNFGSDTDASSYASSAIPFSGANNLALITIAHQRAGSTAAILSALTGSCITNPQLVNSQAFQVLSGNDGMLQIWAALTTASSAAMTVNFGVTISGTRISVSEHANVNTSIGTNGVLQSGVNVDNVGSGTALSCGLPGAFTDPDDATFVAYAAAGAPTYTPKAGWTELRDGAFTPANNMSFETQFLASNDGTAGGTLSGANRFAAVMLEIAETNTVLSGPDPNSVISGSFSTRDW